VSELEAYITTMPRMEAAIRRLAARIDAPDHLLPTFDHVVGDATPFIEQRGDGFHYIVNERGTEYERVVSADATEILALVFLGITFDMAVDYERAHRVPGADSRRLIWARQLEILEQLDSSWARRRQQETEGILKQNPYRDE
jgi:hypothetical protein